MLSLISLIPRPIPVKTDAIIGELMVKGNIEQNIVQFRFKYENIFETAPVCLTISALGKTYQYYCAILEDNPGEVITPVFTPEFCVGQCFSLLKIQPLVYFFQNEPEFGFEFDK